MYETVAISAKKNYFFLVMLTKALNSFNQDLIDNVITSIGLQRGYCI